MSPGVSWESLLTRQSNQELESRARNYLWLADNASGLYDDRLAQVVAEAERRGVTDILERARRAVPRKRAKRGVAGRR